MAKQKARTDLTPEGMDENLDSSLTRNHYRWGISVLRAGKENRAIVDGEGEPLTMRSKDDARHIGKLLRSQGYDDMAEDDVLVLVPYEQPKAAAPGMTF